MTPDEVAQQTLDNHAIHDHWNRKGYQIRDLIVEAIEMDRASTLQVTPQPLPENHILGLREKFGTADVGDAHIEWDHSMGYGGTMIAMSITVAGEDKLVETIHLQDLMMTWAKRGLATIEGRHVTSRDVTPGEKENNE